MSSRARRLPMSIVSAMTSNTSVRLARRPAGLPVADDWLIETAQVPDPGPGQFVVRTHLISLDPAMRGWLDDRPSYLPPVGIGEVMRAMTVGEVVASQHHKFGVGSMVLGTFGVQDYALSDGDGVTLVDSRLGTPSMYLGVLGTTGLTAYFGLMELGKPRAGDTVVVSAAAGGVGSVVGQLPRARVASTFISTTSAARCSMRPSATWRWGRASSSAGPSRSTTPGRQPPGPPTT